MVYNGHKRAWKVMIVPLVIIVLSSISTGIWAQSKTQNIITKVTKNEFKLTDTLVASNAQTSLKQHKSHLTYSIINEGFEGAFPGIWSINGTPTWGVETYRAYSGVNSVYVAGGSVAPPGPYHSNTEAWMFHGPFSLAGAQEAVLNFKAWIDTELDTDLFSVMASTDGNQYYGTSRSGFSAGWKSYSLDLKNVPTLGNLLGRPKVWIAFLFRSNGSVNKEGVYVDDIILSTEHTNPPGPDPTSGSSIVPMLLLLLFD